MEDWIYGPDEIIEAESLTANNLTDAVKIRNLDEPALKDIKPISVYTALNKIVKKDPNHIALVSCKNDKSISYTYAEYWSYCNKVAKSFIKLGLKVSSCVAIMGFNAPEWIFSLYGAIFAGGVPCGIHITHSDELIEYILKDSNSEIVVVENKILLDKILTCRDKCNIKSIVQYKGEVEDHYDGLVMNWREFLNIGSSVKDLELSKRIKTIAPNKCATLAYTSGSTSKPKGVMLSHDNIYATVLHMVSAGKVKPFSDKIVSYLPLSHIAPQLMDCYGVPFTGSTLFFAEPDALSGSLSETLLRVKPTVFFGVPKVLETIQDRVECELKKQTTTRRGIFNIASLLSNKHIHKGFENRYSNPITFYLANKFVLNKVKEKIGIENCRLLFTGGGPMKETTLDFFHGLGFPTCEFYGLTESTAPHLIGLPNENRVLSVGNIKNNYNKTMIVNDELYLYGRNIFMGYLNNPELTKEVIDKDGWLLTGDIANIDSDGFVFITGKIKKLTIPVDNAVSSVIEGSLKNELNKLLNNCINTKENNTNNMPLNITLKVHFK